MGKNKTISVTRTATEELIHTTSVLRRAVKFRNTPEKISEIIRTGQTIISRHKDILTIEAKTNWAEQVTNATEYRSQYEKAKPNQN